MSASTDRAPSSALSMASTPPVVTARVIVAPPRPSSRSGTIDAEVACNSEWCHPQRTGSDSQPTAHGPRPGRRCPDHRVDCTGRMRSMYDAHLRQVATPISDPHCPHLFCRSVIGADYRIYSHHTDAIGSQPGSGKRRRALDEPAMHLGVIVHHVNRFFPRVDAERGEMEVRPIPLRPRRILWLARRTADSVSTVDEAKAATDEPAIRRVEIAYPESASSDSLDQS